MARTWEKKFRSRVWLPRVVVEVVERAHSARTHVVEEDVQRALVVIDR